MSSFVKLVLMVLNIFNVTLNTANESYSSDCFLFCQNRTVQNHRTAHKKKIRSLTLFNLEYVFNNEIIILRLSEATTFLQQYGCGYILSCRLYVSYFIKWLQSPKNYSSVLLISYLPKYLVQSFVRWLFPRFAHIPKFSIHIILIDYPQTGPMLLMFKRLRQ